MAKIPPRLFSLCAWTSVGQTTAHELKSSVDTDVQFSKFCNWLIQDDFILWTPICE